MYERLEETRVYRLAEELSDEIWKEVSTWDRFAKQWIGGQLVDAADSVGSNIAESYGRFHPKDKINFLYFARGSLYETRCRLNKAGRRGIIKKEKFIWFIKKIEDLAPQLNAYISSKKKSQ